MMTDNAPTLSFGWARVVTAPIRGMPTSRKVAFHPT
jgi:hypothetical protein